MKIISKIYDEVEVLFSKNIDEDLYINATKIAKNFNKKPETFLKTKSIQDYIVALKSATGIKDIVIVKQGGKPQEQGTWIYKKLIIAFARWLSPDFAVWCDIQIEDILQNGTQVIPKRTDLISVSKEELEKEFLSLKFILDNFNLSEKEKISFTNQTLEKINFQTLKNPALKKREPVFTLTQLLKEFQIPILTKYFNLKLQSFGIVEYSENGWKILEMKFGENRKYQGQNNPKYYKSTFRYCFRIIEKGSFCNFSNEKKVIVSG